MGKARLFHAVLKTGRVGLVLSKMRDAFYRSLCTFPGILCHYSKTDYSRLFERVHARLNALTLSCAAESDASRDIYYGRQASAHK